MTYTAQDSGWLLGGRSEFRAFGPIEWQEINTSYRAYLRASARGFKEEEVRVCYNIPLKRASEPSLTVHLRGICAYRLDVNGDHRDGAKFYRGVTHIQRLAKSDQGKPSFEPNPTGVPAIVRHKRVSPSEYRAVLGAFAAPIGLDILDVVWTDPPERRHP
ncbi:hypothetical protein R4282_32365 [Rhodococcus oxybenzonivorans]|uniref:hypothetical protein n=1 Tax=Rhodococcus oxybenzonivorans TaxID=1990687 RepID=UPI0029536FFA|nr:hypothetical protein [Rhodococcus oxybenzonivorans]MDV7357689.1 hypothetical protein [Rhodococcus oxybenzonivorans]